MASRSKEVIMLLLWERSEYTLVLINSPYDRHNNMSQHFAYCVHATVASADKVHQTTSGPAQVRWVGLCCYESKSLWECGFGLLIWLWMQLARQLALTIESQSLSCSCGTNTTIRTLTLMHLGGSRWRPHLRKQHSMMRPFNPVSHDFVLMHM